MQLVPNSHFRPSLPRLLVLPALDYHNHLIHTDVYATSRLHTSSLSFSNPGALLLFLLFRFRLDPHHALLFVLGFVHSIFARVRLQSRDLDSESPCVDASYDERMDISPLLGVRRMLYVCWGCMEVQVVD